MLTITLSNLVAKGCALDPKKLYLHNHVPLCLMGEKESRSTILTAIVQQKQVEYQQETQLITPEELSHRTLILTPEIHFPKYCTLHELTMAYGVPEQRLQEKLKGHYDFQKRFSSYSFEQQLIFQTILQLQHRYFLVLVDGTWESCSNEGKESIKEQLREYCQEDGYLLVNQEAKTLFHEYEEVDVSDDQKNDVMNFLEESISLPPIVDIRFPFSVRIKQLYWPRYLIQIGYLCSTILLLFLFSLLFFYHDASIQEIQDVLQKREEQHLYSLTIEATRVSADGGNTIHHIPGNEELEMKLQTITNLPIVPLKEGNLYFFDQGTSAQIQRDGQRFPVAIQKDLLHENSSLSERMVSITSQSSERFFSSQKSNLDRPGIYVSKAIAKEYGLQEDDVIETTIDIPVRSFSDEVLTNSKFTYEPLMEQMKVALIVKGIVDNTQLIQTNYYAGIYLDEDLYEHLQEQAETQGLFQHEDDPKNVSQMLYASLPESTALFPYHSSEYLLLADSQAALEQAATDIQTQLQGNVRVMNPQETLTDSLAFLEQEQKQLFLLGQRDLLILSVLTVAFLLLFQFCLQLQKKRQPLKLTRAIAYQLLWMTLLITIITLVASNETLVHKLLDIVLNPTSYIDNGTQSFQYHMQLINSLSEYQLTPTILGTFGASVLVFSLLPFLPFLISSCFSLSNRKRKG